MTTTSVFQGIQEGTKLSSRVLKPPGGGSSISFMDEPITTKSSGQSSPQELTPKSSFITHDEGILPKKESPTSTSDTETKNGMGHPDKVPNSGNSSYLKENIPPISEKDYETALNTSLNGCDINKESLHITDKDATNTKPLLNGVNGVNGTHENGSNMVNEKFDSSSLPSTKVSSPLLQNGSSSPASLSASNSSLVASPSMKPNQDTQERVIGNQTDGAVTPKPTQQPRKIKDHMRSSIIMSDEDYTPTRSSRFNATINDTPPENLPSAGQRQRIPPGGFSSKLW